MSRIRKNVEDNKSKFLIDLYLVDQQEESLKDIEVSGVY